MFESPLVLLFALMVAQSASEVVQLHCDVSAHPGGVVRYKVKHELVQNCKEGVWEDFNRTNLVVGNDFIQARVQAFTNWTLDLRECSDYVRFLPECPGFDFVEAICKTDCSSLMKQPVADPPAAHNPAEDHLADASPRVVGPVVLSLIIVLLVLGIVVWKCLVPRCRRKRNRPTLAMEAEEQPISPGEDAPPDVVVC